MKRSRLVRLALMGSTPFMLAACGEEPKPGYVYSSVQDCLLQGQLGEAECRAEFDAAQAEHQRTAPRYKSQADCEADFGAQACQAAPQATGGTGWFMPAMAGFLVGQMMNRPGLAPQVRPEDCRNRPGDAQCRSGGTGTYARAFGSQPLYRSRDDWRNFRTAGNHPVAERTGFAYVDADATKPQAAAKAVSRGGFGRAASARSSFGG